VASDVHGRGLLHLLKATWSDFGRDDCGTRAAALAYSTVFALPPLLVLLVTLAGLIWSPAEVQHALETQFSGLIGPSAAQQIHQMIAHGRSSPGGGLFSTVASIVGLLLGAIGAFMALQQALNRAWNVKPDPAQGGVWNFISKRLLSAGMVLGLGFILAASLAITSAITALGGMLGGGIPPVVMQALNFIVTLIILAVLFAAIFKVLPDAEVGWHDVWVGGAFTAVLFVVGKFVIGLYLGHSKPGDAFGAASALAVILVWAYYSGMIILLGAEFTQEWATEHGHAIEPEEGAVRADVADREAAGERATGDEKSSGRPASGRPAAARRGGVGDWIIGLPVLVLLFRRRNER